MREDRKRETLKLKFLGLVLALVLTWYAINPAPGPVSRSKPEGETPDEKRRELEPQPQRGFAPAVTCEGAESGAALWTTPDEGEDDFEWPEFIDG